MIVLLAEVCSLTGACAADWVLPAGIVVRPLQRGEERVKDQGIYVIVNEVTHTVFAEFPAEYHTYPFRICTNVPDRSSIGCSLLHFLLAVGFAFPPLF